MTAHKRAETFESWSVPHARHGLRARKFEIQSGSAAVLDPFPPPPIRGSDSVQKYALADLKFRWTAAVVVVIRAKSSAGP